MSDSVYSDVKITHADGTISYEPPYEIGEVIEIQNYRRQVYGVKKYAAGMAYSPQQQKGGSSERNGGDVPQRQTDD